MKRLLTLILAILCLAATGPQPTQIVMLKFADHPEEPCTREYAADMVLNQYNNWLLTESHGVEWLTGSLDENVWGWWTLPHNRAYYCPTSCNTQLIYTDVQAMVAPYFDWYAQKFIVLYINALGGGFGGFPIVYAQCFNNPADMAVLMHEGGHAHRLMHAATWSCPTTDVGADFTNLSSGGCLGTHYGDFYDPMGNPSNDPLVQATQHYSTYFKSRLEWLQPINTRFISSSQSVSLWRADALTSNTQEIRLPITSDWVHFYTLEYRVGVGVLIRVVTHDPLLSADTFLVNGTYPDPWNYPIAITSSAPFYDPYRSIQVQMLSSDADSATLNIILQSGGSPPPINRGRKKHVR